MVCLLFILSFHVYIYIWSRLFWGLQRERKYRLEQKGVPSICGKRRTATPTRAIKIKNTVERRAKKRKRKGWYTVHLRPLVGALSRWYHTAAEQSRAMWEILNFVFSPQRCTRKGKMVDIMDSGASLWVERENPCSSGRRCIQRDTAVPGRGKIGGRWAEMTRWTERVSQKIYIYIYVPSK